MTRKHLLILLALAPLCLGGCTSLVMGPILTPVIRNLNHQTDPDLVCEGAPSFLLALDSLLDTDPDNRRLLFHATQAYTAYAGLAPECGRPERALAFGERAKEYGLRLLALQPGLAGATQVPLAKFDQALGQVQADGAEALFWGGYGWAAWIAASEGAPAAIADLPKVEQLMLRVVALDERIYHGGAHLFLGIFYGSRPALLGGRPEASREHFERAIALSRRRFLPALVAYAEYYARPSFDRELFVSLLQETLAFDLSQAPEMKLGNVVAKRRAQKLLTRIDDFF